jgi:hypothetical protein
MRCLLVYVALLLGRARSDVRFAAKLLQVDKFTALAYTCLLPVQTDRVRAH